jgi:protocatechuate 3,4-dioxygenase beta subunit
MNDDLSRGRLLSRREAMALLGLSGAALLTRTSFAAGPDMAAPSCVVRPQQTEGPYFVDEVLKRSDIRADPKTGQLKPGVPLQLAIVASLVSDTGCQPLAGAHVDLWQCDALGVYSDVVDRSFDTVGQAFLRGYQLADDSGAVRFTTIYPGWYRGRTVHLHFKVRTDPAANNGYEFTSQLYFDDALTDRVHAREPYVSTGRRTRNVDDGIYRSGGDQLILALTESGAGYAGQFHVGVHPYQRPGVSRRRPPRGV